MKGNILETHVFQDHVLLGAAVAVCLIPFWTVGDSFIFWMTSIFVDVDHGFRYLSLTRFRSWSPRKMFRYFERAFELREHSDFLALEPFHTVEFGVLLSIVTAHFFPQLLPAFLGYLFHMIVDAMHLWHYQALNKRCHSFWEYEARAKAIMTRGGDSWALHLRALRESLGK